MSYPKKPGHRGVDTSIDAANSIERCQGAMHEKIIDYLIEHPLSTYTDIMKGTGMIHPTVTARLRELALGGRIKRSGMKAPTPSGRMAHCYCLTDAETRERLDWGSATSEIRKHSDQGKAA